MKTETNECDEINYQEKTFTHTHAFKCLYLFNSTPSLLPH